MHAMLQYRQDPSDENRTNNQDTSLSYVAYTHALNNNSCNVILVDLKQFIKIS